jgi:hypothetical protein
MAQTPKHIAVAVVAFKYAETLSPFPRQHAVARPMVGMGWAQVHSRSPHRMHLIDLT